MPKRKITYKKPPKKGKPLTIAQKKKFMNSLNRLSSNLEQMDLQIAKLYVATKASSFWIIG